MSKLIAVALAVGVLGLASAASAMCPGHQQTVSTGQTVVDSGGTTLPITPVPTPETKTGG